MYLECIARLKPGVSIDHARTHMDQIAAAIAQAYPSPRGPSSVGVRPLQDHVVGASMRSWMIMLFSAVGIVLVIACANVANLLLARATTREREVAVRAALGASRWRLLRQFIVESLVLSAASTVVGVLAAWWVVEVLRSSMPEGVPRVTTIALDLRVLAAATGLAVVTGLLFGLVPALQSSKPNLRQALTESTRGASRSRARRRLGNALVVAEVALAVVLLVGAALFLGSFIRLMRIDPGFAPDGILTMQLYSQTRPGQRPPDWSTAFAQIVERLDQDQKAGIVHASAVAPGIPLSVRMRINGLAIRGDAPGSLIPVSMKSVTPAYYKALRIPLRSGRFFDETDREGGLKVTILNESAATAAFPGQDAVGRTVVLDGADHTVVGVVGDVRQRNLEREALAEAYVPMTQSQSGTGFLVIRTSGDPYAVLPAVRTAVWSVMPDVPLRYVTTMEDLIGRQTAQRRLTMLMLGLFGLLGLVIAAVGVYGVMAYVVSQRTREIGVRMALGATRSDVTSMVIANAGTLVGLGLVLGGTGAWYFGGAAQRFLFGLEAHDPRAFVAAIVVLTLAAMAASVLPARRAASVDPTIALRAE
jgi:predicted permease